MRGQRIIAVHGVRNKGQTIPASDLRTARERMAEPMDLVRLAIPRRVYTQSHIDYVAEACAELFPLRHTFAGLRMTNEPKFLRHFSATFEEIR